MDAIRKIVNSDDLTAFGILKKYANPELIPQEDGVWAVAVKAKHAIH
jgi:hypothetical protein